MNDDKQVFRLSDHDGVDRLNELDQFLRSAESANVEIDTSGKDIIPTPVLQTLIAAGQHWTQRDLRFSISGCSAEAHKNFRMLGADLTAYCNGEVE